MYALSDTTRMLACAPMTRSVIGKLRSPKKPTPKIVVQTIVMETMKAPMAEKAGRQRAASQNKIGNSQVIGDSVSQGSRGSEMTSPVIITSVTSANVPSTTSLRGDGRRTTAASPITSGATAMMPIASDANQCCQVSSIGADGPRINR